MHLGSGRDRGTLAPHSIFGALVILLALSLTRADDDGGLMMDPMGGSMDYGDLPVLAEASEHTIADPMGDSESKDDGELLVLAEASAQLMADHVEGSMDDRDPPVLAEASEQLMADPMGEDEDEDEAMDGDLMAEVRAEMEAEAAREREEAEIAARDAEVAAAAEAAAAAAEAAQKNAEADKLATEKAKEKEGEPRAKTFFRPNGGGGAAGMRATRQEREATWASNPAGGERGRSRVPKTSQPGSAEAAAAGASGLGGGGVGQFDSLNARMRSMDPGSAGGAALEGEEEPEGRAAARALLDPSVRRAQARAVKQVLDACGGGVSPMLGDAGLDWYRVLGLRPPPFALGLLGGLGPRLADLGLGGGGGTGPAVSNAQVKQEYRARALAVHPDKNLERDAPRAFELLQEAYETLGDEAKRAAYDRQLAKRAKVRRARVWREVGDRVQTAEGIAAYVGKTIQFDKTWRLFLLVLALLS
eukprot:CAMPEP_0172607776 /NCGR_PEP_ID=MMETSP1068-20121228/27914_1 /TAXON_ID=35684 /ORGANISM="Pseudopedinella elastica, Strain CCMP716" /LENGTH=474 /DNA_ID=CAMNT_0013410865 /DNA_START=136 /DNA_END=1560 /DNA_ORIENTATION=-